MTASTTLKLPAILKERIAPLAEAAGKTAHAWMVEALEAQTKLAETRRAFVEDARKSAAEIDAGGALYAMQGVHAYIAARAAGHKAARPKAIRRVSTRKGG